MTNKWGTFDPQEESTDINGFENLPLYERYQHVHDAQCRIPAMNRITQYEEFILYCLRRLGAPLINIEVADEQIRDRVTDALQFYLENHIESVEKFWFLYKITKHDLRRGYVQMPPHILDVTEVKASWGGTGGSNLGDISYEMDMDTWLMSPTFGFLTGWVNTISGFGNFSNAGLFYYELMMQELSLLRDIMTAKVQYSWRHREKKLYLYAEAKEQIIMVAANKMLDPDNDQAAIFDSPWLKSYATALIGQNWGSNLQKFGNINAGGNVTISGDAILARYTKEKEDLETNFIWKEAQSPIPRWA